MFNPAGVAIDGRDGPLHLYVSDRRNHRILGWQDARASQTGAPPNLILGQPNAFNSNARGIGVKGLMFPAGLAVDPASGDLYVVDAGDNRVLRFPKPFADPTRLDPDAVYGQPDFATTNPNSGGVGPSSMSAPQAVAFDTVGNLWVADTGNHRVLRINASALHSANPPADLVIGQSDFASGNPNGGGSISGSGFDTPLGLGFDQQNNLYVSDSNNARVLKFAAPVQPAASAATVFGQPAFNARVVAAQPSAGSLVGPAGLAVSSGTLYVALPGSNRVLLFAADAPTGSAATDVLGQPGFTTAQANFSSFPSASTNSLAGVSDLTTDQDGNLFLADSRNNRVIALARGSRSAFRVWGQSDFQSNGVNQVKSRGLNSPSHMAVDYSQAPFPIYVSDTANHRVLVWKDAVHFQTGDSADLVVGQPDLTTAFADVDGGGSPQGLGASLSAPKGIAIDASGNLWVADSGNHRVLRFPRPVDQSGRVTADLVLGQPDFTQSSAGGGATGLRSPSAVALGPDGAIFVADTGNNRVLKFTSGVSSGGPATAAFGQPSFNTTALPALVTAQTLSAPEGIYVTSSSELYVADTGASRILVFIDTTDAPPTGAAAAIVIGQYGFGSSFAGGGTSGLNFPRDVALDSLRNIYVADTGNNRVLVYSSLFLLPLTGATAGWVIGQGDLKGTAANWDSRDGSATADGVSSPAGLWLDRRDTVYVADGGNNRVVHFLKPLAVVNAANPQPGAQVARGGMVVVTGGVLSDSDQDAQGAPLPRILANREVLVADTGIRAPLASVHTGQITLQMPSSLPVGTVALALRVADTGEMIGEGTVPVAAVAPALYTVGDPGSTQGKISNSDGSANGPSNAAAKGSTITILGTGQGPVSLPVTDGEAAPGDPAVNTIAVPTSDGNTCLTKQPSVCVAIAGVFGNVQSSSLAPGMVGIWQLKVNIPANAASGSALPLRAVINGAPTNIVTVAIK